MASQQQTVREIVVKRKGRKKRQSTQGVMNSIRKPTILGSYQCIGFPDEYRCTLKYSMEESISGATGAIVYQAFRANSLFDPDFTNTGHQPTYYDQLCAVYGRYYVKACKLRVVFVNTSATLPIMFTVTASDIGLSGLGNLDALAEAPYSWTGIVSSIASGPKTVETPMLATSKIMGQKITEPDDNMYATTNANPIDVWWYEIAVQAIDKATTSFGYIRCTLEFECMFKELNSPGESLVEEEPVKPLSSKSPSSETLRRTTKR